MAKKETIKTDDVFSSQPVINDVVNTTDSIFKKSNKTDAELDKERISQGQKIVKTNRKKFTCSKVYAPLYPDGFISSYQGIPIEIYFDGSTVELAEPTIKYVQKKIEEKAEKTADRLNRFHNPQSAMKKIGETIEVE